MTRDFRSYAWNASMRPASSSAFGVRSQVPRALWHDSSALRSQVPRALWHDSSATRAPSGMTSSVFGVRSQVHAPSGIRKHRGQPQLDAGPGPLARWGRRVSLSA